MGGLLPKGQLPPTPDNQWARVFKGKFQGYMSPVLAGGFFTTRSSQVGTVVKNLSANAGDSRDTGSTPGLARSPGGGNDNSLQYSSLKNAMGRGAWWATKRGYMGSQRLGHN